MTEDTPTYGPRGAYGPRPGELRRTEVARAIGALADRLVLRALALGVELAHDAAPRLADTLRLMIFSPEGAARQEGARHIGSYLLDVGEREDPAFWATDLGRAIAREIGYVSPWPTRAVAEKVLQVSRQAIQQMIVRGGLQGGEGGLIDRESLQLAAAKRWPFDGDAP